MVPCSHGNITAPQGWSDTLGSTKFSTGCIKLTSWTLVYRRQLHICKIHCLLSLLLQLVLMYQPTELAQATVELVHSWQKRCSDCLQGYPNDTAVWLITEETQCWFNCMEAVLCQCLQLIVVASCWWCMYTSLDFNSGCVWFLISIPQSHSGLCICRVYWVGNLTIHCDLTHCPVRNQNACGGQSELDQVLVM